MSAYILFGKCTSSGWGPALKARTFRYRGSPERKKKKYKYEYFYVSRDFKMDSEASEYEILIEKRKKEQQDMMRYLFNYYPGQCRES
jgi:hypothetical protein